MESSVFSKVNVARFIAAMFLLVATASAGTVFNVSGANTSLATAEAVPLNPDLVVNEMPPNYTLGTAQSVSPQYYAEQGFGAISTVNQNEWFSTAVTPGQTLDFQVSALNPVGSPTELLLYDANGNLVAIAAGNGDDGISSLINFTVPSGDGGNWVEEVTSLAAENFNYDLSFTSPFNYKTDVFGALNTPSQTDFYTISTNVGNDLNLSAMSTSPLLSPTELLLYDANGNLVAIADGNGADGVSSLINFTVPSGDAGNWVAAVTSTTTDVFDYDLSIQGATGLGSVNPNPTPEPGSWWLVGGPLIALGIVRRSHRNWFQP
jgi:hypothetical protein